LKNGADSTFSKIIGNKKAKKDINKNLEDPNSEDRFWSDSDEPDIEKRSDIYSDTFDEMGNEDEEQ